VGEYDVAGLSYGPAAASTAWQPRGRSSLSGEGLWGGGWMQGGWGIKLGGWIEGGWRMVYGDDRQPPRPSSPSTILHKPTVTRRAARPASTHRARQPVIPINHPP
jgi:hypothetical protein